MDSQHIDSVFKKINKQFDEGMTYEQRMAAFQKFKSLYAQQLGKVSNQMSKRKKVNDNLDNINETLKKQVKEIDEELRKKMQQHQMKRQKYQQNKVKGIKMMDENWRRKQKEISQRHRQKDRQAYKKADKMRLESEKFWERKSRTSKDNRLEEENKNHQTLMSNDKSNKDFFSRQTSFDRKTKTRVNDYTLPTISKFQRFKTVEKLDSSFKSSALESQKNSEIQLHIQKSKERSQQRQALIFQSALSKLMTITQRRNKVQKKKRQQVELHRKTRQQRQNPQLIKKNRQKSIEIYKSKSKSKEKRTKANELDKSLSRNKINVTQDIQKHLENKKKIEEEQSELREYEHEQTMKKLKKSKVNRLIKDTLNLMKHSALKQSS